MSRARDIADGKFANDLTVETSSSGEFNALTISQGNNTSGNESRIRFKRTTDAGSDREVAAIVADRVGGNDTALVFETNTDGSDGATERVRITQDGNVGISNTAPTQKLSIGGDASGTVALQVTNSTAGTAFNDGMQMFINDSAGGLNMREAYPLQFYVNGGNRMTIASGGSVGIGTDSPGHLLHLKSSNPTMRMEDSDGASNIYGLIQADGAGSITIAADDGNNSGSTKIAFLVDGAERMRINSGGHLFLGQTATTQPGIGNTTAGLGINATGRIFSSVNGAWSFFNRNTDNGQVIGFGRSGTAVGGISVTTTNTSFNTSSDYRLKQGVEDMVGAIERVKALAPKRFQFIADADTTVDGFLAHEAQAVVAEAVTGTKDEVDDDGNAVMQGIDQSKLVPLLTGALKEAIAKIETLETEMTDLKASVAVMEAA